jgi:alpha-L-glutamate ligase-like protein
MWFHDLKAKGILGINNRVGRYILRYNQRKFYPFVDDKSKTDHLLANTNIRMPKIYKLVESHGDLKNLEFTLDAYPSFVLKPASGSQGNGIIVITDTIYNEKNQKVYVRSSGKHMSLNEINYHISSILSGLYSLSGRPDKAIIQQKLTSSAVFNDYSYGGIPDIRVITFMGYPIMAMVRLPTKGSQGRANLHQGAVGCGLDIMTGKVVNAVCLDKPITTHPDTNSIFTNLQIPNWKEILLLASRVYEVSKLGYMGVDIVLDASDGPMLLEMNARPGLSIQLANQAGLVGRLEYISEHAPKSLNAMERVEFILSQAQF